MEHITVNDIVKATGGKLLGGDGTVLLSHISIDSRSMQGSDLFVPLVGEKNNAHRFINQAVANGAKAVFTSEHDEYPLDFNAALIRVNDTQKALQDTGSYIRDRLTLPLVGITGSVGKTTTREMVAAALSAGYQVFKTPANYNSQIGVPITISEIGSKDGIGVLELGMSEPGEMTVIAGIARVDMAVITNVGVTHIENLGSRENILREKLNIQDGLKKGGVLLLNGDNDLLKDVKARDGYITVRYGTSKENDYRAEAIVMEKGRPSFTMVHGDYSVPVKLQIMGEHNVLNALAALAVADHYGVNLEAAAQKLYEFDGFKNRQQIYERNQITLIDDTYNASPDSMKAGLRVLSSFEGQRRIAVLADMKELGKEEAAFHYEIGEFLRYQPIDVVITYGELAKKIAEGVNDGKDIQVISFDDGEKIALIDFLKKTLTAGDAVLFKGSNSMKLGEVTEYFIKKWQVEL